MGRPHDNPNSPESKLVGGAIQDHKEAAENASPVNYVSESDPPFLFIHGTSDKVVPFSQSELLEAALKKVGVKTVLVPVTDGGHGNFGTPEVGSRLRQFFDKYLLNQDVTISAEPIKVGTPRVPQF